MGEAEEKSTSWVWSRRKNLDFIRSSSSQYMRSPMWPSDSVNRLGVLEVGVSYPSRDNRKKKIKGKSRREKTKTAEGYTET